MQKSPKESARGGEFRPGPDRVAPALDARPHISGLSAHERMLLFTDGTFTLLLEAFIDGPIEVDILTNVAVDADETIAFLFGRSDLEQVCRREVLLVDAIDRRPFVFARSYIDRAGFDPATLDRFADSRLGIGRIINALPGASAREFLDFRLETNGDHLRFFGERPGAESLCRTYRIFLGGTCVAVVTEKMPRIMFGKSGAST